MKIINSDELLDLAKADGGKFAVKSLDEAYQFVENIATAHYENFPVGSLLVPKILRPFFYSVYAYARIADDIADESDFKSDIRIDALSKMSELLRQKVHITNPLFLALHDTIIKKNIPLKPLENLLIAFKKDIEFSHPNNINELFDYCTYSANPIGELVLRIFDEYNEKTIRYSDKICTSLQLINFWQDLSRDLKIKRYYIPLNILNKNSLTVENLVYQENSSKLYNCLEELYLLTEQLMSEGQKIVTEIKNNRLKMELKAIISGGSLVLSKSRKIKSEILFKRPKLSKLDYWLILLKSIL